MYSDIDLCFSNTSFRGWKGRKGGDKGGAERDVSSTDTPRCFINHMRTHIRQRALEFLNRISSSLQLGQSKIACVVRRFRPKR